MLRYQPNFIVTSQTAISCAEACEEWLPAPIASYYYDDGILVDNSSVQSGTLYSWQLMLGETVLYDFGKGNPGDVITAIGNGSTNNNFIVGYLGSEVKNFIATLPVFYNGEIIGMRLTLDDSVGRKNRTIKYYFS